MRVCVRVCVCATLIGTRTDTRVSVPGKPLLAIVAHGRAVSGAGHAGFGPTVRASAFVRRCKDKNMGFRHSPASNQAARVCNFGVIPSTN